MRRGPAGVSRRPAAGSGPGSAEKPSETSTHRVGAHRTPSSLVWSFACQHTHTEFDNIIREKRATWYVAFLGLHNARDVLSTIANMSLITATAASKRSHALRYTSCAVCRGSSSPKHGWHTGAAPHRKCAGWCRQWGTRRGRSPPQMLVGAHPAPAAPHWPSATRHPDAFAHRPAEYLKVLLLFI